jgi:hypothetical protein
MTHASRSDVQATLAQLRTLLRQKPPSGPNYPAEAARDRLTEQMVCLAADDDAFLVECLAEAFDACRRDDDEREVCGAIILALRRRDSLLGAADVLGRIALAEPSVPWLSAYVVQVVGTCNPRPFERLLREAAGSSCEVLRAWAAESLIAAGLATPTEIDALLRDPDEGVQRLTARGLAELRTADAIFRLTERALHHDDGKAREQAWWLLGGCRLAPARGGEC